MFSTTLAWLVFVLTSLHFIRTFAFMLTERYQIRQAIANLTGHRLTIMTGMTAFLFTAWAISGVYLFG